MSTGEDSLSSLLFGEKREDKTPEQAEEIAEELISEAMIMQILQQGRMSTKVSHILEMLPANRRGCFVRERDDDILHYQQLGYRIETEAMIKGVHGTGDARVRVGDVILMTTSIENFNRIQAANTAFTRGKIDVEARRYLDLASQNQVPGFNESVDH